VFDGGGVDIRSISCPRLGSLHGLTELGGHRLSFQDPHCYHETGMICQGTGLASREYESRGPVGIVLRPR